MWIQYGKDWTEDFWPKELFMIDKKIGFLGVGKMGTALIEGLIHNKSINKKVIVINDIDKNRIKYFKSLGIQAMDKRDLIKFSDIIFFAVKPNQVGAVCKEIKDELSSQKIIISIAAGITIKRLEEFSGDKAQIVRIMPNTPALVNQGMSVFCVNKKFNKKYIPVIKTILGSVGHVLHLDEKYFDVVTGLSGSGPAYIFLVINSLAEGGVKMGLPKKVALELAVQTVLGSAQLVQQTGKHPEDLKDMVTSPGGTTVEGLKVLEEYKMRSAFIHAVEAATLKSKKLGN